MLNTNKKIIVSKRKKVTVTLTTFCVLFVLTIVLLSSAPAIIGFKFSDKEVNKIIILNGYSGEEISEIKINKEKKKFIKLKKGKYIIEIKGNKNYEDTTLFLDIKGVIIKKIFPIKLSLKKNERRQYNIIIQKDTIHIQKDTIHREILHGDDTTRGDDRSF